MDSWHSYPSIFAIGHRALQELLLDPVLVEEKIDGSQFSFGKFRNPVDGKLELYARSRGAVLNTVAPEKMFTKGVEVAYGLDLHEGWTYRGEYLAKPKHNSLAYDRHPEKHIILFDINTGHEAYLSYAEKKVEAERLGLEIVPLLHDGMITDVGMFRELLDRVSILGGQKIEGVVVKNYNRFGPDKKVLMGKFVSEAFKEVHAKEWKNGNPGQGDIITRIVAQYATKTRWAKARQHLTEAGLLEGSPRDIGHLIKETQDDILKEAHQEILSTLMQWALPQIRRQVTHGLPEWYKEQLLLSQFDAAPSE